MVNKNIHGNWTMSFDDRFLHSEVIGSTNTETSMAWFEELKQRLLNSTDQDTVPWVALVDSRRWNIGPAELWDANNVLIKWCSEHNCIFFAVVYANKLQEFSAKQGIDPESTMQIFFNYDEALKECQHKLLRK
ncbi:hypothetical protein L4C34_02200 [Vibrio profundum]|uniref:hypothetical protein n=1 Tax=Vibrio profundum TaxID=2910247 RepID=UPI003D0F4E3E